MGSMHFSRERCLAISELSRLMRVGEIPHFWWEWLNPSHDVERGPWETPGWLAKGGRARTLARQVEIHSPFYVARLSIIGHEEKTAKDQANESWAVKKVEVGIRNMQSTKAARHPKMRTVYEERELRRTSPGILELLDLTALIGDRLKLRQRVP